MTTTAVAPSTGAPRAVLAGVVIWLALAIAFSAAGGLAALPFPFGQLIILALIGLTVFAATAVPSIRSWVDTLSWQTLVGLHAMRLVGVVFVILGARGAIASAFAVRAGWGDIAAAVIAIGLVAFAVSPARSRWIHNFWNAFGLLDLIVAVGTATAVVLDGRVPGMAPLFRLPLSLVPLFFVPLLVTSHIVLLRRINAR